MKKTRGKISKSNPYRELVRGLIYMKKDQHGWQQPFIKPIKMKLWSRNK